MREERGGESRGRKVRKDVKKGRRYLVEEYEVGTRPNVSPSSIPFYVPGRVLCIWLPEGRIAPSKRIC